MSMAIEMIPLSSFLPDEEYRTLKSFLFETCCTNIELVYGASMGVAVAYRLFMDPEFTVSCAWFDGAALKNSAGFAEWLVSRMFRKRKKLHVVFNAGIEATGSLQASIDMVLRVLKSIAVPLGLGFVICDVFVTIGWIGLILKGKLPVRKIALICNPVIISLLGQLMNYIAEGLDSGFESFGWLLMYLVCALKLVEKEEQI